MRLTLKIQYESLHGEDKSDAATVASEMLTGFVNNTRANAITLSISPIFMRPMAGWTPEPDAESVYKKTRTY